MLEHPLYIMPRKTRKRIESRKNKQSPYHIARAQARKERQKYPEERSLDKGPNTPSQSTSFSSHEEDGEECTAGISGFDVSPLRPSLRVLALFDGIGTCKHVLDKLGIHIEVYYTSEVDEGALRLQRHLHGESIKMVGPVQELTHSKLQDLGIINLLIGGSPCNDLSLVNHRRRGLHGPQSSGQLFFEYVRILETLRAKAEVGVHSFFWIYENTRKMEISTISEISRVLGCEPVSHNACRHLPVERDRLFWGNIPSMDVQAPHEPLELDDILSHDRTANVKKVPTLTTSAHSQRSGPSKILPVNEGGVATELYISEREQLFGFPKGYTDGTNLSLSGRRRLLGKAFCVPVLEYLLTPLKDIFWTPDIQLT